ncbi:host attachment protein [Pseudanabaena sp. PCC 6802]|uniref:host attachment protein n=1 Tax=Pseudanabaena sp. PCC 6802 TaxID=118173 RepID=UPI00034B8C65|nr:host attachment protein [Pseudanabaena sp. PCC 6802]
MSKYLVAAIDGTKARFLTLENGELGAPGPHPVEHEGLVSPAKAMQGQELWSSSKTGRNRGVSGQAHSYDDRREHHTIEFERRFAHAIATRIVDLVQTHRTEQLLLVAEPQILGLMREALAPALPKHLKMSELAKDLCHFKPHELHEYLASRELLPAYKKAGAT